LEFVFLLKHTLAVTSRDHL